jgi:sulfofructose kinase
VNTPKILCLGAATLDTIFRLDALPAGSGKFIPLEAVEIAAGMASSAAIAAARLGADASICACVGDDAKGAQIVAGFAAEGIDCRFVRRVPGARSAFATILVDRAGERIIVPRYDPGLLADIAWLPLDRIGDFDALLVDVRWPAAAAVMLEAARAAGVPSVLDADVAPLEVLQRLASLASHCVFSEPAAYSLSDTGTPEAAVRSLAPRLPAAFIAVTAGAAGCWWSETDTGRIRHLPAPDVAVVDTLSAGDVFHGVFTLGLAEGRPIEDVIARANAAASLKCTRFGGRLGSPRRAELDAFLADRPSA